MNIGWYVHGGAAGEWKRLGGHWVAVVGSGVDGHGRADPRVLLIDNPAVPGSAADGSDGAQLASGTRLPGNADIGRAVMKTVLMEQGRLVGNCRGLPRDAAGMYGVWGAGVAMPPAYDAAMIDGAIVLVVGEQ